MSTESIIYQRGSNPSSAYDRINSNPGSNSSSAYVPDSTPAHRSEQLEPETSIVSQLIKSSSIYRQAYDILSKDRQYGTSYLSMLEMIPYNHEVRDRNFWDDVTEVFGGTSGYDNAVTDAFNAAMDEIRTLMQDYYSFLSKLPVEQVEQLRDAGINAAITGEGVSPSSMTSPDPSGMVTPNPSQSEYDNTSLSQGVSSFVEFINSMANLSSVGVNSANILGLLDIAERDALNKQETHDLLLAGLGVTSDSPYRTLTPDNTPAISVLSDTALAEQRVKSAEASASADALESPITVNIGNDPDSVGLYEIKSGKDWLSEMSRFQIANRFGNVLIQNLRTQGQQLYTDVLTRLEGEYNMANFAAQTNEAQFNSEYFLSRNGSLEGQNQTSLTSSLSGIRQMELNMKSVEEYLSNYRSSIIQHWGEQLEKRPSLAPFFYKGLFDFGMEDTFYHQSSAAMGLKYGMNSLNSIGSFIGHVTGFKMPFKKVGSITRKSSPKGEIVSETTRKFE